MVCWFSILSPFLRSVRGATAPAWWADRSTEVRASFHGEDRAERPLDRAPVDGRVSASESISDSDTRTLGVERRAGWRLPVWAWCRSFQDSECPGRRGNPSPGAACVPGWCGPLRRWPRRHLRPSGSTARGSIPDAPGGFWACDRRRWYGDKRRCCVGAKRFVFRHERSLLWRRSNGPPTFAGQLVRDTVIMT